MRKTLAMAALLLAATGLASCQTTSRSTSQSNSQAIPDEYTPVITGGLGIQFADSMTKLEEAGLRPNNYPQKYYEVGEWRTPLSESSGFFNFGLEVATAPISKKILSITGYRVYGRKEHFDHYTSCTDDYTMLRTQIEQKYSSLHKKISDIYESGEFQEVSYYEGKGRYQYIVSPRYFGRSITLTCSIQKSEDVTIGSMLLVRYAEDYDTRKSFDHEKQAIFNEATKERLKGKGLSPEDL